MIFIDKKHLFFIDLKAFLFLMMDNIGKYSYLKIKILYFVYDPNKTSRIRI